MADSRLSPGALDDSDVAMLLWVFARGLARAAGAACKSTSAGSFRRAYAVAAHPPLLRAPREPPLHAVVVAFPALCARVGVRAPARQAPATRAALVALRAPPSVRLCDDVRARAACALVAMPG